MRCDVGELINGVWSADRPASEDGEFRRSTTRFHNWITADGSPGPTGSGGFGAESGRYHLYVSYACPWAHRTLIFRTLKGLGQHIGVSVVHPEALQDGWSFSADFSGATGDLLYGLSFVRDLYLKADPTISGRVTVPILWDKHRETIVSNESSEIIRMFNSAFDGLTGNRDDFWPQVLRAKIEEVNARIYDSFNNGVYRAGFARNQGAYDRAVVEVFETLDWIEDRLDEQDFLMGQKATEADWRLFPTLARFDLVYHTHFKCNHKRIIDYPNLWRYARRLYQWPGIAGTVNFEHIARHYYFSHETLNPNRIVPIGPVNRWSQPA